MIELREKHLLHTSDSGVWFPNPQDVVYMSSTCPELQERRGSEIRDKNQTDAARVQYATGSETARHVLPHWLEERR